MIRSSDSMYKRDLRIANDTRQMAERKTKRIDMHMREETPVEMIEGVAGLSAEQREQVVGRTAMNLLER